MIVLKVELWPLGDAAAAESLGVLLIKNVGQEPIPYLDPNGQRYADPDVDQYAYELELQADGGRRRGHLFHHRRRGWKTLVRNAVMEMLH